MAYDPSLPFPNAVPALDPQIAAAVARFRSIGAPAPRTVVPVAPEPPPEQGFLTDIGHGFARGAMVTTPEMVGKALQAFGADETGKAIADAAKARGEQPEYRVNPEGWGSAASSVVPALATAASYLIPGVGEFAGPALTAGLFGGSQYTETREKGGSVGQGVATGLVQGVGQAVAAGVGARLLSGATKLVRAPMAQQVLDDFVNPSLVGRVIGNTVKAGAIQAPVQAIAAGSVAGIESGLPDTLGAWEAAKAAVPPALMMTALMAPFAGVGTAVSNRMKRAVGETVANPLNEDAMSPAERAQASLDRLKGAQVVWKEMKKANPAQADAWYREAQLAIAANQPVAMATGFKFEPLQKQEQPQAPAQEAPPQLEHRIPTRDGTGDTLNDDQRTAIAAAEQNNRQLWAERDAFEQDQATQREAYAKSGSSEEQRVNITGLASDADQAVVKAVQDRYDEAVARAKGDDTAKAAAKVERDRAFDEIEAKAAAKKQQDLELLRNASLLPKEEYDAAVAEKQGDVGFTQMRDAWDRAIKDAPDWEISNKGEQIWKATKQDRMLWLRDALGTKTPKFLNQLVDMGPAELAASLQMQWHAKGGEAATVAYAPRLEALYRGITGKDIREVANDQSQSADAKAAEPATPGATAGATAEAGAAVREDGGNAATAQANPLATLAARMGAEEGERNALAIREQSEGGVGQREGTGGVGQAEGLDRQQQGVGEEGAANGGGGRPVESASVGERNAQAEVPAEDQGKVKPAQVRAYAEAVNDRREAKAALDANRNEFGALMRERSQLLAGKESPEQAARLRAIEARAGELAHEHEQLIRQHDEAMGDVEHLISGPEPTAEDAYFASIGKPLDPKTGVGQGDNFLQLRRYLEALVYTREATPEQRRLFGSLSGFKPIAGAVRAATDALKALTKEQRAQYDQYVNQFGAALKTAARMLQKAKEQEANIAQSLSEERMTEANFNERLDIIARNLERGVISEAQADRAYVEAMNDAWRSMAENDVKNRGIAAFNDKSLAPLLEHGATASDVMTHLSQRHNDPLTRAVTAALAKANPTAIVRLVPNADFNGGRYVPSSNEILIGRGGLNAITLTHETTHALTHAGINRALRAEALSDHLLNANDRAEMAALKVIRSVQDAFFNKADLNNPAHVLALQSEHEFVAEALNNPSIRDALGGRSTLWQKFVDGVRQMIGMSAKHQTDFERLFEASHTLFGNPDRTLTNVFNDGIAERKPNSPLGAVQGFNKFLNIMGAVSPALSGKFIMFAVARLAHNQEVHAWLTLNNLEHQFDWLRQKINTRFPDAAPVTNKLYDAFSGFRTVANGRKSDNAALLNEPLEAQAINKRMWRMHEASPEGMSLLSTIANNARAVGIHPKYKTLAEAQRDNPAITKEQFDHSAAAKSRVDYARMAQISKDMEARGATDTPLKLYEDGLLHNNRMLARNFAQMMRGEVQGLGFKNADALDFTMHQRDASRTPIPVNEQIRRLDAAMRGVYTEAVAQVKNRTDQQAPAEAARRDTLESMLAEYDRQRAVPYYHLGREGDHFISFTVKGGDEEWKRVGAVVGGEMNRDWRDPLPGGKRTVYMKFNGQYEHNEAVAKIDTLHAAGMFEDGSYAKGPVNDYKRSMGGATPAFMRAAQARIDGIEGWTQASKDQAKQALHDLYLAQMPESSPLKSTMLADNTMGASRDTTQMFIKRMDMGNRALVNARSAMGFADVTNRLNGAVAELNRVTGGGTEFNDMRNQVGVYVRELQARQADMQQPQEYNQIVGNARAMTAVWRLGMSPMYIAMVGYQPYQITFPALGARYGFTKAATSMAKNTALAWAILNSAMKTGWLANQGDSFYNKLSKSSDITVDARTLKNPDGTPVLNARQLDLMDHLMGSGLINFGMTQQLMRADPNALTGKNALDKAMRVAQIVPHYIEMANRILSALSAHELSFNQRTAGATDKVTLDAAHEYAKREAMGVIRDTDGDHSQVNVARRLGQRGVFKQYTPLVVGFGQYDIQMTEFLGRAVQRALSKDASPAERKEMLKMIGGIGVMTGAVAGALGLPFAGAAAGLYNMAKSALQEEGETPPDAEKSFRDGVRAIMAASGVKDEATLNKMEEVFSRGLPRALGPGFEGFDMSGRSGYQDLLPFTSLLTNRAKVSDRIKDGALDFMGPAIGALAGVVTGARAAYEGDYVKAINDGLPVALRNAGKAYRLSQYGYETSGGNNQIPIPATGWDVMMQSIGALSAKKAEQSEKQFAWTTDQQILQARHTVVMNEIMRAADHNDYPGLQRALQRSIQFAIQQPQFRSMEIAQSLTQRAQERAIGGLPSMEGVMVKKGQLPYYQRFAGGMPEPH